MVYFVKSRGLNKKKISFSAISFVFSYNFSNNKFQYHNDQKQYSVWFFFHCRIFVKTDFLFPCLFLQNALFLDLVCFLSVNFSISILMSMYLNFHSFIICIVNIVENFICLFCTFLLLIFIFQYYKSATKQGSSTEP